MTIPATPDVEPNTYELHPVVARCAVAHADPRGGYVRGVVVMRDGRFFAGTEELHTPTSLMADFLVYDSSKGYPSIEEAKSAADHNAVITATDEPFHRPLPPEYDITQTIQSVESRPWRFINECDEIKAHLGELHEPGLPIQFFAGIETSHQGGESEISWSGPLGSRDEAVKAADGLVGDAEESATSYTEPRWSSPGMR